MLRNQSELRFGTPMSSRLNQPSSTLSSVSLLDTLRNIPCQLILVPATSNSHLTAILAAFKNPAAGKRGPARHWHTSQPPPPQMFGKCVNSCENQWRSLARSDHMPSEDAEFLHLQTTFRKTRGPQTGATRRRCNIPAPLVRRILPGGRILVFLFLLLRNQQNGVRQLQNVVDEHGIHLPASVIYIFRDARPN